MLPPSWKPGRIQPSPKGLVWVFLQREEVSCPTVQSQRDPVPRHRPTMVGWAPGDPQPHEMCVPSALLAKHSPGSPQGGC